MNPEAALTARPGFVLMESVNAYLQKLEFRIYSKYVWPLASFELRELFAIPSTKRTKRWRLQKNQTQCLNQQ